MAAHLNEPPPAPDLEALRREIRDHGDWPEDRAVTRLLHALELTGGARHRAVATAMALVDGARARRDERPFLDAFLQEFGLSNQEGIALMCIAEALLRIPDDATADRLIAEKLATGDWSSHAGKSESLFVNASTWGLMLTGGILELDPSIKTDTTGWMRKFTRKAGEPLVRLAVRRAMRIIGGEFVVGRSIEEALARSAREPDVGLCSFDMLGEGARTQQDAQRYLQSYEHAIDVIGAAAAGRPAEEASSISIKLSALEPRYSLLQHERVMQRLVPQATALARRAAALGIQLTIDAEEADRLDLSLDVIEALAMDPATTRLAGPRARGTGLRQARPGSHRLGRGDRTRLRQTHDGAPGEGCVLGFGNQARAGTRPRRISGVHAQGHHGCVLSGVRRPLVQPRRCHLSAICDA